MNKVTNKLLRFRIKSYRILIDKALVSALAVFLDWDVTLNVKKNYFSRFDDEEWIPGAVKAIQRINRSAYLAIVVANQAGIARGHYGQEDVQWLHF